MFPQPLARPLVALSLLVPTLAYIAYKWQQSRDQVEVGVGASSNFLLPGLLSIQPPAELRVSSRGLGSSGQTQEREKEQA